MALIKISDLNPDSSTGCTASENGLIELQSKEAALIRGGWRSRRGRHLAADKLMSDFTSRILSVSSSAAQGSNTFQITIPVLSGGSSNSTANINGVNIAYSGNLFYTDSDVAPIGAAPIPGFPGAYTF
jgi:hypothetical protein